MRTDRDGAVPTDEGPDLVALIAGRMERLIDECEAGLEALEQSLPSLRDARDRVSLTSRTRGARGSELPLSHVRPATEERNVARVQVDHATIDELLDFQEQLARIPGVTSVSISAMGDAGASLVVEIEPSSPGAPSHAVESETRDAPTVLCAVCGRVISKGSDLVSHGLCPNCTGSFMRGEVAR
jgi:hypothetical protein